jgi:hypothetical protein
MNLMQSMDPVDGNRVFPILQGIARLKYEIEARAAVLGYDRLCAGHIPVCKGECCKWHYPRHLDVMDFFLALTTLAESRRKELLLWLSESRSGAGRCPLLTDTGCFFDFEERPIVCTAAYPCFNSTSYWAFQASKTRSIRELKMALEQVLKR